MVDVTFAAKAARSEEPHAPANAFGTIIVVGGGCYGTYYVRQLRRAAAAGAVRWSRLLVVDRDRDCAVARAERARADAASMDAGAELELVEADWHQFFDAYLATAASGPERVAHDAIVPSPLMPHLLFDWLLDRARQRWPDREVSTRALPQAPEIPWQRADAVRTTRWVSFAEWMCPVNCIEPARCPHTRGERTWSMSPAMHSYVASLRQGGVTLDGPVVLQCTHRAYGVGMIDTADVLAGDALVRDAGTAGPAAVLVGTVSHCHGAWDIVAVGGAE